MKVLEENTMLKNWNIVKEEVAAMKAMQSKPTQIYLKLIVYAFALFMFCYGYFCGKEMASCECSCKKDEESK